MWDVRGLRLRGACEWSWANARQRTTTVTISQGGTEGESQDAVRRLHDLVQGAHGDAGGAVRRRRDPAVRHDEEALGLREEEQAGDEGVGTRPGGTSSC